MNQLSNNSVADSAQRQLALDPGRSFIVSAPAGSGKTGLITQRVLRLLCTVDNPEEILCITFTRKAAGEMNSRIHSALQQAAYQPRPVDDYQAQTWDLAAAAVERNRQLGWNLLEMPGRLRIQTIDGFCRYIASQFALETKLGALPEPSEQPQVFYQQAARNLLEKIEEETTLGDQLAVLLAHTGNNLSRCEQLLADTLGKREQWLPLIFDAADNRDYFQQVIDQIISETLLELQEALLPIAGELVYLADFAASHIEPGKNPALEQLAGLCELPDCSLQDVQQWKILLQVLITKKNELRKRVNVNDGFPPGEAEAKKRMLELLSWCADQSGLLELIVNAIYLPEAEINSNQQRMLNALGYLLPALAAELELVFKQHDKCDYPAITLAALEAIEPSPQDETVSDITLRLDYQLQHILVDEFQDTSGAQIKLLDQLIAGWQPDDGRTLFLVGDAMQSLYGFRNANVGLFINAQRHPIGPVQCTPLTLSCNFRSQQGVIDWVNNTFARAFPAQANISRGAIPYSPSAPFKGPGEEPAVSFRGFSGDDRKQAEASYIADICCDLSKNRPGESIAILVRGRHHLKTIVPALRQAGLKWQAIDITPLASRMPVMDMLSLTRAILSPADRIAWLSLLRAPFCGLNSSDLLAINLLSKNEQGKPEAILSQLQTLHKTGDSQRLSKHGKESLQRILPPLIDAWNNRARNNLRQSVEQLWVTLGGPATLANSSDLSDIRSYLDLLEQWQSAGVIPDWAGFQQAMEKLYAAPTQDNSQQDNQTVINLMTIHKSKGLEFDHVILPGLEGKPSSDKKPLLRWCKHIDEDNHMSLVMAPLGAHDEEDDSVYSYLKQEDSFKTRLENTRVLYVAATRAIRKLYLTAGLTLTDNHDWKTPGKGTLLASIWDSISDEIERDQSMVHCGPEADKKAAEITSLHHLRRLPASYSAINTSLGALLVNSDEGKTHGDGEEKNQQENLSNRARLLGTVLHRTLKQMASEGLDHWPAERRQKLPAGWKAQLVEQGMLVTEGELVSLSDAIETMLADAKGQWILGSHPEARCEQSLGYCHRDQDRSGVSVIDRTFVADGQRWIIDYKLSSPGDSESREDFIARQSRAYQAQLRHYANLYRELEKRPVRCALYFPGTALFVEMDV